jgi:hypothetical protein
MNMTMVPPEHQLPSSAAAAFIDVVGRTLSEAGLSRDGGLKLDQGWQTIVLEPSKGPYVLRLARDCPFDEISPAYLVLFVRRLSELCPGIDIAHRIQCGHPIVASVRLALSEGATQAEWQVALSASLPLLEAALKRQSEAAGWFHDERPRAAFSDPWPAIEVSPEQVGGLARFGEALKADSSDRSMGGVEGLTFPQEIARRMEEHLAAAGLLDLDRDWTPVLLRPELGMGFMDEIHCQQMDAAQVVAVLNAVIQGGRYSETLPRRAFGGPMVLALLARAKELAG